MDFNKTHARFADAISSHRNYDQETMKAMIDAEDSERLQPKVALPGKAPDAFLQAVFKLSSFMDPTSQTMKACAQRIEDTGGLNSLKDARVQYRSQDGLALFRHVKELTQAHSTPL